MKNRFPVAALLPLVAGCAAAPPPPSPVDQEAVQRFLERELAQSPDYAGEKVRKLDQAADSIVKAPVDRSEGLVAALVEQEG